MAGSRVVAAGSGTITKDKHRENDVSDDVLILTPGLDEVIQSQAAPGDIGDLSDPDAIQGTRFTGPILSGAMEDGAAGTVILSKRAKVSVATGNFTVPIKFPASSILINLVVQLQQTFSGVAGSVHMNLGSTPGASDIATIDLTVAPTQINQNLATILGSTWTIYLTMVGVTGAQGKATGILIYSVPAASRPS